MVYDIYLYTLCYYICCLLGACMRCTWLCSLKPGVTRPSSPASPPPRGRAPPPQLAVGEAKAGHPIPTVRPRSGGPVLIRSSLILAVRRRSSGPGPLPPHPVSLPFGPRLSARPRARSARRPRLSACPRPALPARSRLSAAQAAARSRARPPAGSNPGRSP
jgi:hypothetical protein